MSYQSISNQNVPVVYGSIVDNHLNSPVIYISELENIESRKSFVSKVYSILWVQILITSIFIGICNQVKSVSNFMNSNTGINLLYLSMFLLIILSISLICCVDMIRKTPYNWMYLSLYTILMTFIFHYSCWLGCFEKIVTLVFNQISHIFFF